MKSLSRGFLLVVPIAFLNAFAFAGAQFGIPVTFTNGTNTTVVVFGVSGDGVGGTINDNTRGIDIDTALFNPPYLEVELPPAPPVPVWEVRFAALPGDPSLGTGLGASYYGFTSAAQVDNYLIDPFGSAVSGAITISWPNNIGINATACVMQGNLFDPGIGVVNMLTSTSVVVANGILLAAADIKITKTGAASPTGPGCDDISFFNAKCNMNGAAQAMVKMSGDWSGETIGFDLDGDDYISPILSNGTNSIAKMTVPHAGMGAHTVTLEDPAGCYSPVNFNCQVDAQPDPEWEALLAEYEALEAQAALKEAVPVETRIIGNYPNPFNPSTTIRYALSVDSPVSIRVYNLLGQEVATLVDGFQKAGEQSVTWHGTNNFGQSVASGLYIYRLQAGNTVMTQKMLFTK